MFHCFRTTALLWGLGWLMLPALADADESRLYRAADRYRDSVQEFERLVHRNQHLDRRHERVVDALEDATARLRGAARDEHRVDRLLQTWRDVATLHRRTEAIVFANPVFPGRAVLAGQWLEVTTAFGHLHSVVDWVFHGIGGGIGFDPWFPPIIGPPVIHPPVFFPPYCPPYCYPPVVTPVPQTDPFAGGNHPSQWNPNRGLGGTPSWTETPGGSWRGRVGRAQSSGRQ